LADGAISYYLIASAPRFDVAPILAELPECRFDAFRNTMFKFAPTLIAAIDTPADSRGFAYLAKFILYIVPISAKR